MTKLTSLLHNIVIYSKKQLFGKFTETWYSVLTVPVHELCVVLLQLGLEITIHQNLILQFCNLLLQKAHLTEREAAYNTL